MGDATGKGNTNPPSTTTPSNPQTRPTQEGNIESNMDATRSGNTNPPSTTTPSDPQTRPTQEGNIESNTDARSSNTNPPSAAQERTTERNPELMKRKIPMNHQKKQLTM